jgi:transcriptional regulator with XRE-family HTH domain
MYGSLVRRAREERGLTQAELAEIAGLEQPNISAIESGRRVPSAATLHRLLHACGFVLTATAGPRVLMCDPPDESDPRGDVSEHDDVSDLPIETRVRMLVGALDAAEAIVRGRGH